MSYFVKRREYGENPLKTRHFLIGLVGLLLWLTPEIIAAFYEQGFPWKAAKEAPEKLGEAAIISAIIAYFLDVHLVRNVNNVAEYQVNRIKIAVFEGVIGHLVDKDLLSVFSKTVLKC